MSLTLNDLCMYNAPSDRLTCSCVGKVWHELSVVYEKWLRRNLITLQNCGGMFWYKKPNVERNSISLVRKGSQQPK